MRTAEETQALLTRYKEWMLNNPDTPFESDYELGLYNGLEIALSVLESRPFFLVDRRKRYNKEDIKEHPDHFL